MIAYNFQLAKLKKLNISLISNIIHNFFKKSFLLILSLLLILKATYIQVALSQNSSEEDPSVTLPKIEEEPSDNQVVPPGMTPATDESDIDDIDNQLKEMEQKLNSSQDPLLNEPNIISKPTEQNLAPKEANLVPDPSAKEEKEEALPLPNLIAPPSKNPENILPGPAHENILKPLPADEKITGNNENPLSLKTLKEEEIKKPEAAEIITAPSSSPLNKLSGPPEASLEPLAEKETVKPNTPPSPLPKPDIITAPELPLLPREKTNVKEDLADTVKDENIDENKFTRDEATVLLLPNDEVVLGQLTYEAKLDNIDFYKYFENFKKNKNKTSNTKQSIEIDNFVNKYNANYNHIDWFEDQAKEEAFEIIKSNNISALRFLIDHYPILQATDDNGDNLLQRAVEANNYIMAKYLLMRGVNINKKNYCGQTPLMIARRLQHYEIENLLLKAGANQ